MREDLVDNVDAVDDTSVLVFSEGGHLSKFYLSRLIQHKLTDWSDEKENSGLTFFNYR